MSSGEATSPDRERAAKRAGRPQAGSVAGRFAEIERSGGGSDTTARAYHPVIPLHYQIQRVLRTEIESGKWATGDRIPPEVDLMRRFHVSRTTIRGALRSLESDGLIVRHRAKGTFVSGVIPAEDASAGIKSLLLSYRAEVKVLSEGTIPVPPNIAPTLEVAAGDQIREFRRLEIVDGVPLAVVFNYVRIDVGQRIGSRDLERYSMLELLRDHLKLRLGTLRQIIGASLPDEDVALLLGSDLSQPVLAVRLVVYEESGIPIQVCDAFYRGDRYRYEMMTGLPADGIANLQGIVDMQPSDGKPSRRRRGGRNPEGVT